MNCRFWGETLTESLAPPQLDRSSPSCEKSQNAFGSTLNYSSHRPPKDFPQTPARCPTACTPLGQIRQQLSARLLTVPLITEKHKRPPGWPTACAARRGSSWHPGWGSQRWRPAPLSGHSATPPPSACDACKERGVMEFTFGLQLYGLRVQTLKHFNLASLQIQLLGRNVPALGLLGPPLHSAYFCGNT